MKIHYRKYENIRNLSRDFIFVHHACRDEFESFGNHADLVVSFKIDSLKVLDECFIVFSLCVCSLFLPRIFVFSV